MKNFCFILRNLFIFSLLFFFPILYLFQQPNYNGFMHSSDSKFSIKIVREKNGLPHIYAKNWTNGIYGMGIVHCQDRLWSMVFKKLIAQGRLSEYFGKEVLAVDKHIRNLLLENAARINIEIEYFEAYSLGINDCVADMKMLPLEFHLTRVPWKNWTIVDTMSVFKLQGILVSIDWRLDIIREKLADVFGYEIASQMFPVHPEDLVDADAVTINDDELKDAGLYVPFNKRKDDIFNKSRKNSGKTIEGKKLNIIEGSMYDFITGSLAMAKGSNCWVIHGNHTETGKPILASDPHMDNGIPSIWYALEIHYGEDYEEFLWGASLPGIPLVAIGKTNYFTWGVTVQISDSNSDLYEELIDDSGKKYFFEGKYYDLEIFNEEIKIKDEPSLFYQVKKTRKGPILNELFLPGQESIEIEKNISFAWGGYMNRSNTLFGLHSMYFQKDLESIKKAAYLIQEFYLNMISATKDGDIMYFPIGLEFKRLKINDGFYKNGTLAEDEWQGAVPLEEKIVIVNPKKGYFKSANNKYTTDNTKHSSCYGCYTGSRAKRIKDMIKELFKKKKKIGVEDMKIMQHDIFDCHAERYLNKTLWILEQIVNILVQEDKISIEELKKINFFTKILKSWDFQADKESLAAAVYYSWDYFYTKNLLFKYPDNSYKKFTMQLYFIEDFYLLYINETYHNFMKKHANSYMDGLCKKFEKIQNIEKLKNFSCVYALYESFFEGLKLIEEKCGKNILFWNWGCLNHMDYPHPIFNRVPLIKNLFDKKLPSSGSRRTVNVAHQNYFKESHDGYHSANLRFIDSLGDESKSCWGLDMGQSENWFNVHFDDHFEKFKNRTYFQTKFQLNEEDDELHKLIIHN